MDFPQFRKYPNGLSFFRINSPDSFEELKRMGEKWMIETYEVKILPDRNFVNDLLTKCPDFAVCIEEKEYLEMRGKATGKG
ncbi:MAG TPA: hypothetical protein VL651_11980 [Bacteroidia bacterium]|jgi:hypothetical protein|nr:hypothetical protein [Bacteroidia bacterium]